MSAASRYKLLRGTLVILRRLAARYGVNFDNAVESSRKALLTRHVVVVAPITVAGPPPDALPLAAEMVRVIESRYGGARRQD